MVIIKLNAVVNGEDFVTIMQGIQNQAKTGVILLPSFCDLLNEVPADEEIQIIRQDERVAELEAELARAMFYISALKDCSTCKNQTNAAESCWADCGECCLSNSCVCAGCFDGSKWEWVGAHGNE